ncbi:MAG: hypothetical protein GF416_00605 [Candidatus Altiarchaeales archaeon]|nr:hypothetical protein [Candidatus Altiarchaeales archaeon]MBD3415618.1 hypothetical protein [Candidatus Altiarchaeales archaeon]
MEEEGIGSSLHFYWEILIVFAALVSVVSLLVEFTIHLDEEIEHALHLIDYVALSLFGVDILLKYRIYRHHSRDRLQFLKANWLDILAVIPLFRIFRMSRFARLSRLVKMRKSARALSRVEEVTVGVEKVNKGVSGVAHGHHITDAAENLRK